jgi:hypothetical protein
MEASLVSRRNPDFFCIFSSFFRKILTLESLKKLFSFSDTLLGAIISDVEGTLLSATGYDAEVLASLVSAGRPNPDVAELRDHSSVVPAPHSAWLAYV